MKNENWQKIETIFHQALSFEGEERRKYLEQTCFADSSLRNEVTSLLASLENEREFLEQPVVDLGLNVIRQKTEKSHIDTTLGFYEIGRKLGSGGMGEVYKAIDTRLNRKVALKFLPEFLKNDNAAKRQLQKEAQAVAMLEHPNICAVHGLEQIESDNFIVMQFVEGETLEKRLKTIKVSLDTFKSLAKQLVNAIALAHSHGIIHRDLKPGNIMISDDNRIKILDFGLAKVIGRQKEFGDGLSRDSSRSLNNGLVIGTISYMSPEQLRGERLDYQTDIFSLGIILYELLAGKNPFHRNTKAETIAAILSDKSISAEKVKPKLPPNVTKLIDGCLEKDKNKRFQSAAEVLIELDKIERETSRQIEFKNHAGFFLKIGLAAVVLISVLTAVFFYNGSNTPKTVVVLPISSENLETEKEYLADGLTRSIIDKLSNLSDVKVKNESLVARYKARSADPQTIGRELNADAVFVGSIVKRNNELFLTTKIIRTTNGILLDSNEIKIDEKTLIDPPESIVLRILDKINSRLTGEDKNKVARKDTESLEARRLYELGRFTLKQKKESDYVKKAAEYFFDAKEIDPKYAKAWAGLANAYLLQSGPHIKESIPPEQAVQLAKIAARKALELDNTLSESYNSLGLINSRYDWNWSEAEGYLRTSISLDSESISPRLELIQLLIFQKRFDEALAETQNVKNIDPFSITSDTLIAQIYYRKNEFEIADNILADLQQRFPENQIIKYRRTYPLIKLNRFKEAITILEPFYQSDKDENKILAAAPLGFSYAKTGRRAEAKKIIFDLDNFGKKDIYVPAQEKALIYVGLGDFNKVFDILDKACREKFWSFPGWVTDPIVEEVREDPRSEEIKRCVNF